MTKVPNWLILSVVALSLSACLDIESLTDLEVENENDPDRADVLAEPADVETLIGSSFLAWIMATHYDRNAFGLSAAADETAWAWGWGDHYSLAQEPRIAYHNDPTRDPRFNSARFAWEGLYEALASAYDGLVTIDSDDGTIAAEINLDRARAFARFVQGLAHGYLALVFDSAYVLDETVDVEVDTLVRLPYPQVMAAALGYFDDAIGLASGGDWNLDASWINGREYSATEFIGLIHGFKARYMTQVARTPEERVAVQWPAVLAEVDNNLGDDFTIDGDGGEDWWHDLQLFLTGDFYGGRVDYKTIGYTDTGGGYAAWLSASLVDRDIFLIQTPDARVAGDPADGTVPGTDFRFFGFQQGDETYLLSGYVHQRYQDFVDNEYTGPMVVMSDAVQQLIKAEGLLRTGDKDGAAEIINVTRVGRGGLPPALESEPDSALFGKLFYEVTIENCGVCPGCAYFNKRGWAPMSDTRGNPPGTHHWGLVEGTPRHFPMPASQLELQQQSWYTYGGVGNEGEGLGQVPSSTAPTVSTKRAGVPASMIYSFSGLETFSEKLAYLEERRATAARSRAGSIQRYR